VAVVKEINGAPKDIRVKVRKFDKTRGRVMIKPAKNDLKIHEHRINTMISARIKVQI
jgi:hypothetical protein